ncbi:Pre-mRNA-splicing factor 8 homolog, partial [Durusdinium trenchii]
QRLRGVHALQEAHQRPAQRILGAGFTEGEHGRFESDSESTLHPVVVAHHQPCQRLRGLPGATGPHGHFHARKDPHAEDFLDPDPR